jgi:quinol monooxygenase YgiN
MIMIDERELENRIERIPAAPDRLFVVRHFAVSDQAAFESQWRDYAALQAAQDGCIFQRLHHDLEKSGHYMTYDLWWSRLALIGALRNTTAHREFIEPASQSFIGLVNTIPGQLRNGQGVQTGRAITVRHFRLKVGAEQEFERLWSESARSEARQTACLAKLLHHHLNLPTYYISYSVWTNAAASEHAASQHTHWQTDHKPYPLATPVVRELYEVRANLISQQ